MSAFTWQHFTSLSGLCVLWDSLSSFPSLWLGMCTLGWPIWPMIGFPLLGVHPSISIVKLIMIGYCCNHLDGQPNCWASAHWLISVMTMYWLHDQWLGHSTDGHHCALLPWRQMSKYFDSQLMRHKTAKDLLENLKSTLSKLNNRKLLQISADGPEWTGICYHC